MEFILKLFEPFAVLIIKTYELIIKGFKWIKEKHTLEIPEVPVVKEFFVQLPPQIVQKQNYILTPPIASEYYNYYVEDNNDMTRHYFICKLIKQDGTESETKWDGLYQQNTFPAYLFTNKEKYKLDYNTINNLGVFHYANYNEIDTNYEYV